jgi:molybdopterin-guanine dinucleotide biosynthesis protein A
MEASLKSGQYSLQSLLEEAGAKNLEYFPARERDGLININTPGDFLWRCNDMQ